MNLFSNFQCEIIKVVKDLSEEGLLPDGIAQDPVCARVTCEPPRDPAHGDISTNAAMVLSKVAKMKPRDVAELLAGRLGTHTSVTEVSVAGPGFINMRLDREFWMGRLRDVLEKGITYGDSNLGDGKKINIEYVSANPTGPMHVGHARGAVVGDVLASLLEKTGFDVCREYYINDAGAQVDQLARSVHLRYREANGEAIGAIPEGLYPGDYLKDVGAALAAKYGDQWMEGDEATWLADIRTFAIDAMMDLIRDDLASLGVNHAVFSSEKALVDGGRVDESFALLEGKDLIYTGVLEPPKGMKTDDWEPRPQVLFKSSEFGDDIDRPLKKSDGGWTYFASDTAYHLDKFRRGFDTMIDVWGADHGGYVKRMASSVKALTDGQGALDVKLCQLVHLLDGGEPVKMSKRAGTFVTLREVVDAVGCDVVRFIMLTRSNDVTLDFDLQKVTEQTRDNPVFYVQYAHARAFSILRNALEAFPDLDTSVKALSQGSFDALVDDSEIALIKLMATWPRIVESAAQSHEPHRVAYYLQELAAAFHGLWNQGNTDAERRFIVDDKETTLARLALVRAMALVIASGLKVFGVNPVEEMR
ncbi:MAG: arginine--tRNA ligase [Rhodospirillales bacterium]|jgi:arginyl-tRNA synthetase|nr:arginine--tRNA ligase [Rhodospirillales bacterium]MBT5075635.1 arginine--tRNA ligase [Rhodospirillales bacterium]MBT5673629.1 arginine--tRNA ligase [Rhodospirillales bacterium]MBT6186287.1 arginine--tRNA ligase [Rhodospirillales bacterium]MBT6741499.1 arginine--tRNA ligase [Rhodospirillales bacterium]